MNAKSNLGWDYHVPPDHKMVEPILSSVIHPCAIIQAWMWDSNQKNQPGHLEAKPRHPHQYKPCFTGIHPGSLGQTINM